jgi:hypothetical protein
MITFKPRKMLNYYLNEIDEIKFSIGQSHVRQMRKYYGTVKTVSEVDYKVYSQYGEDGIIDYLLTSLNIEKPKFIEIGTQSYRESNTRFLYQNTTGYGVLVDSDPKLTERVMRVLGSYYYKGEIIPISLFVNRDNVLEVYDKGSKYGSVDLLSLDIDGVDYWIVEVLPESFAKVAILEFNPYFGHNLNITIPYKPDFDRAKYHYTNLAFGASLKAMVDIMKTKKMTFVGTNTNNNNAFFVSDNYINNLSLDLDEVSLSKSTENYSRESRDRHGNLSFLGGYSRIEAIRDVEVINLNVGTKEVVKLSSLM